MGRRSRVRVVVAAVTMLAAGAAGAAGSVPAAGAPSGDHKPSPKSMLAKSLGAAHQSEAREDEGEGDGDEAETIQQRGEYQQSITAAPAVTAPTRGLVAARRAAGRLRATGSAWRPVTDKPFVNDPIERGDNFGVGWGLVTGRMTAFTASGPVVYAGSASGGVWRSRDRGRHWRPVNAGLPRLAVGTLATDPRDGSVWVGTGEPNNSFESQYGVGTYRLARGSSRWTRIGGDELYGAGSFRIRWVRGHAYIATTHGLYRRGAAAAAATPWRPVLQPSGEQVYPPSSAVSDVLVVPGTHGRRLLAAAGWAGITNPPATENNGFYVGDGSPGSFHRVTLTGDIDPATIGRATLSSSGRRLYAVVTSTETTTLLGQGVYVSDRGSPAGPWVRIADVDKLAASDSALGDSTSGYYPGVQGWYNQNILADPRNPRHVYLQLEEVFETTDGGRTWRTVGPYWNYDITCNPDEETPYACPPTTHPDQHAGMIHGGSFWAGSDGGVWRRPVAVHERGHWTNLNASLHTTQNYSIDVGRSGAGLAYWGGLQDNGESYTRTGMPTVEQAFTGDGGDTIVDPDNGDRAVEEYTNLDMYLTTDAAVDTLREISPSCLTASDPPADCDPNPRFIAPIEKDVRNPDHWVAGGQYVWDDTKSWDTVCTGTDGCDWQKVYDTGDGHQTTALAANGRTTYAAWCGDCNPIGFGRGLATNYGGTWHELALAGVPNRYITSIAVDRHDAAHVLVSLGSYSRRWVPDAGVGHVYESRNGGATWTNVTGNLPDAPVYKVVRAGHRLVAGTEVGTFVARTGRATRALRWSRLGRGLPAVTVWDLVARRGLVVAGTHGRGEWEVRLGR